MKKKLLLKTSIKFFFFILFLVFSYKSLVGYINGESVFDNVNYVNETLIFPSLTLCPRPKYTMAYLDLDRYLNDTNYTLPLHTKSLYSIFHLILRETDPVEFVQNYSYSKDDVLFEEKGRMTWVLVFSCGNLLIFNYQCSSILWKNKACFKRKFHKWIWTICTRGLSQFHPEFFLQEAAFLGHFPIFKQKNYI